jgi:flagellar biosynthesis/type III secretory pathway M-ring protein FliF/YscJ
MPEEFWANAIFSVVPTLLFGLLFWFVFRAIIRSDRTERAVAAQVESEERAKRAARTESADS